MKRLIFLLPVFFIFSCSNSYVFNENKSLSSGWSKDNSIEFQHLSTDTTSRHQIRIVLRNDDTYPYSNIYLIAQMEFPDSRVVVDTLQYEMATSQGRWLGSGFSYKTSYLLYKDNVSFPTPGIYRFSISHANRQLGKNQGVDVLQGITDVGLQILKK